MKHYIRRLPAANIVAAASTSTFQVPRGPTYRKFGLIYKSGATPALATEATMASEIARIRIKVNGIIRFDVSGADWISLLKYYGYTITTGLLPIPLSRAYARTMAGEENTCWGTNNVETLTLEVDIAAGVTNPSLDLDALYTPEKRDLGAIIQVLTHTFTASTSGQFEISSLPKSNGSLVGLHFSSANLTALNVQLDSEDYFDADLTTLAALETDEGRVPQTNWTHLEPTLLDRFDDVWALEGVQDFRQKLTMSASGSVPIVMETLNVPIKTQTASAA